ncbi:MAG: signal recognition particle-docking protein FtsY [Candidatus Aenigmarchaeota archaeon]|nr:signal recognition particle-docking protein FtsY [Candidatus Aenigmarchaeota archaeon]
MFGFLKNKLKKSVDALAEKAEKEQHETSEENGQAEDKPMEKKGFFRKIKEKEFSGKEIDDFFASVETELMQANLALEVIDYLKNGLKSELAGKPVKRNDAKKVIRDTFEKILLEIVSQKGASIPEIIKRFRKEGRPATILFLGYNGSGKTTTIAKICSLLMKDGIKPVLAAADTFRAASIEQLEVHGNRLGLKVVKHKYGADPAAVIFDARKHAESKKLDVVMADSAGRMHTNVNLMDELKKIVRVNKPDMKVLVVDSLTGNDVVSQVRTYSEEIGIDGIVLTKMDVNEKGGSILSACYVSKKPILYIGTGQEYKCIEEFKPESFVKNLLGD